MKRSHVGAETLSNQALRMETAIHEAGHAVAVYLGNQRKQLPPIYFQIHINPHYNNKINAPWHAQVEGGRLIHTLPVSVANATQHFSAEQKQAYLSAFEADIVNLLVGPLAEANYVALRDDEIINSHLITLNSLPRYGGESDLKIAKDYLDCWDADPCRQQQKLSALFLEAFHFLNDRTIWRAIIALANYLLVHRQSIIEYQQIANVLDRYPSPHPPFCDT